MRTETGNRVENTNEFRKLTYTEDFKSWIHEHPGILNAFKDITTELDSLSDDEIYEKITHSSRTMKIGNMIATMLSSYYWEGERRYYFKIDVNNVSFFIKSEGVPHRGKGYDEVKNTEAVKRRLKNFPFVDVVNYQLGYQDKNGKSYYISKWLDLPLLRNYGITLKSEGRFDEKDELYEKVEQIRNALPEFHDLKDYNMFYDPHTKKIILFDLFTSPQSLYQEQDH